MQEAERAIAKVNPPIPPEQSGSRRNTSVTPGIPKMDLSRYRAAHDRIPDAEFEEAKAVAAADLR